MFRFKQVYISFEAIESYVHKAVILILELFFPWRWRNKNDVLNTDSNGNMMLENINDLGR